jgi:hypothetical protein
MTRRPYTFAYPFPPEAVVKFFCLYYGPTNRAGAGCTTVFAEYLEVIGIRA